MKKLERKYALITGAAQGIGAGVAERYAQEGAHLILVDHSYEGLEKIDDILAPYNVSVTLVPLDVCQENGIEEMALHLENRLECLDILIGNAAILGQLMPVLQATEEMWAQVWRTNFLANWRLLKAFEPLLKKSSTGRVIFVTASQAIGIHPFWGPYSLSKKALEELVALYIAEVPSSSVKVNLIDPGEVDTALYRQANPGGETSVCHFNDPLMNIFVYLASTEQETGKRFIV